MTDEESNCESSVDDTDEQTSEELDDEQTKDTRPIAVRGYP